jgi:3-hydroxyacyl-CoA dehydrogenase/enoyl-CoA hydratase/3-hydroxybutyryl-CoA epimerase
MTGFKYEKGSDGIMIVTMDMEGKVNTMGGNFNLDFLSMVEKLEKDKEEIKGVIITSAKETFFAGADLNDFLFPAGNDEAAKKLFNSIENIKSSFRRLEKLGRPVVAAINGTALGGGFEICLSCHYRIALDKPKDKLGLPEAGLGLLPGAGGTVRMIHLLGPQIAVPFILEAKQVSPSEALKLHIIDELAKDPQELIKKSKEWILNNPNACQPWDVKGHKIPGGPTDQFLSIAPAMLFKKTKGVYPAHEEILKVAAQTLAIDFDGAQKVETRALLKLANSNEPKNIITTSFFQMRELNAGGSRPPAPPKTVLKKLGILGGGMMGRAIAYVCARTGIEVIIKEVNQEAADQAKAFSAKLLDSDPKKQEILDRIKATGDFNDLQGCELIVEAVFENIELKGQVTREAESKLAEGGVFASNTSSLPITKLAQASKKPENFIGIHFFSPVEKMSLVEIIRGKNTSEETLAKAFDFVLQIKKIPIVVNDSPGFFTTRVISTYINEAVAMLQEGVHPVRIDRVARLAGLPVGPLALWDEISQKLFLSIAKANGQTSGPIVEIAELLANKYQRGGKAYGGGIYEYASDGKKFIWPEIIKLYYKQDYKITDQEIKDRFLFIQSLETMRCMEEGVIEHVRDANIGSIYGIGYPPVTGGVIQNVNTYGIKKFFDRVTELAKKYGQRFSPPKILQEKANKNELFL